MKILKLIIATGITLSLMSFDKNDDKKLKKYKTEYEQGWEDGHCEGWKDVKGKYAYCPYPPYAPIPTYDCSKGYRCGYNRGFKRGRRDAMKKP